MKKDLKKTALKLHQNQRIYKKSKMVQFAENQLINPIIRSTAQTIRERKLLMSPNSYG